MFLLSQVEVEVEVEVGLLFFFPKMSRRNSIPINTLYREVDYCYALINKSLLEMFSLLFCLLA